VVGVGLFFLQAMTWIQPRIGGKKREKTHGLFRKGMKREQGGDNSRTKKEGSVV